MRNILHEREKKNQNCSRTQRSGNFWNPLVLFSSTESAPCILSLSFTLRSFSPAQNVNAATVRGRLDSLTYLQCNKSATIETQGIAMERDPFSMRANPPRSHGWLNTAAAAFFQVQFRTRFYVNLLLRISVSPTLGLISLQQHRNNGALTIRPKKERMENNRTASDSIKTFFFPLSSSYEEEERKGKKSTVIESPTGLHWSSRDLCWIGINSRGCLGGKELYGMSITCEITKGF